MASWLKCTARRGGGAIHINLENAVSVYWSERDKGTVIAFIGGEKDAVLVEERPEQILSVSFAQRTRTDLSFEMNAPRRIGGPEGNRRVRERT